MLVSLFPSTLFYILFSIFSIIMSQSSTIVLIGPPGSGKSTQADFLVREMNAAHIDMGLALRKSSELDTPLGRRIADIMNTRMGLVSDDVVEEVLAGALASVLPTQNVVLDGAPRRKSQIALVETVLEKYARRVDAVLSITLSEEESVQRIASRRMCPLCNRSFIAGKDFELGAEMCPSCGTSLERRKDDTESGVRKRFSVFFEDTLPVIEHYRNANRLIEINGSQDPAAISAEIQREVSRLLRA